MAGYAPPSAYAGLSGQVGYSGGLQFIDEVNTQLAKQFRPDGFIYDRIAVSIPVNYRYGRYPVFNPADFYQTGGDLRVADDAPTPIVDFGWSHDVYACEPRRLQTRITEEEALQAHPALRLDYSKIVGLLTVFANNREDRLARKLKAQANGGQITNAAVTPSVKWDAGTSGTPATIQADIQTALLTCMKAAGRRPNTLVLDYEIALAIANDYTVKQQLQYRIGPEILSDQMADMLSGRGGVLPPRLFGLNIVVADGTLQNTGRPGQAMSVGGTWGTSARLLYIPPGNQAQWGIPASAYAFRAPVTAPAYQPPASIMPSGDGGSEPGPAGDWAVVDRWWDYDPPGEHIRCRESVDERIVAPELAFELSAAIAGTTGGEYPSA